MQHRRKNRFTSMAVAFLTAASFMVGNGMEARADGEQDEAKAAKSEKTGKSEKVSKADGEGKAATAKQGRRHRIARIIPNYAYIVPDKSQFLGGYDKAYLKDILSKVKRRRGVKKAELLDNDEIRLEVTPKDFKAENVIAGLEGVRIEMRVPYERIEIQMTDGAEFPPRTMLTEDNVLVVEMPSAVREAINAAMGYNIPMRMKCVGKLNTAKSNEAALGRFEQEHIALSKMVPFMAVGDVDGDKKSEVFLRLKGLPELLVFQGGNDDYRVVPLTRPPSELSSIPRCEQNMDSYVRVVPRNQIKCQKEEDIPKGFKGVGLEVVKHNMSSKIMMWNGKRATYCEPLGEGALPAEDINGDNE